MNHYNRKRLEEDFDSLSENSSLLSSSGNSFVSRSGETVFSFLELRFSDTVLDVGCGDGFLTIKAARTCKEAIGVDISNTLLERARHRAINEGIKNITFVRSSFEELVDKLAGAPVNKVMSNYAMHHLTDDMKAAFIEKLADFVNRSAKIVIGDIMWFEDPMKLRSEWDSVCYDSGDTDFPTSAKKLEAMF
ncbi:MAG TPA: class I SAM-dependent methyltransferase, partial [Kosmotogaceae bacterium]|nr:class I SAM-dependent methyltransferase [Kosmotogaceae bacterium]